MSKCREEFEIACEQLGLRSEKHWYDCGSRMTFIFPEEMYPLFQAAWNVRGNVDAEICREQSRYIYSEPAHVACAEAIEQEDEK